MVRSPCNRASFRLQGNVLAVRGRFLNEPRTSFWLAWSLNAPPAFARHGQRRDARSGMLVSRYCFQCLGAATLSFMRTTAAPELGTGEMVMAGLCASCAGLYADDASREQALAQLVSNVLAEIVRSTSPEQLGP